MNLFDSADPRPVHFLGIGGAGMSALALLACRRGVTVTGCDADPSGAADLAALGVRVFTGHDPSHVEGARAIVYTAAVPAEHAELARARGLDARRGAAQGGARRAGGRAGRPSAVSGTHGKTTTTVMATEVLAAMGAEPTGLAGGRVSAWGGNARIGADTLFVVEADEYDQAFLTLQPTVAIVNNVEPDHLECYGSEAALHDAFAEFAGRASLVLAGADDPGARRIAERIGPKARTFGTAADADIRIADVRQSAGETTARVTFPGRRDAERPTPGARAFTTCATRSARWRRRSTSSPAAPRRASRRSRAFTRSGPPVRAAGRVRRRRDRGRLRAPPVGAGGDARRGAAGVSGTRLVAVFQPHLFSRTAAHGAAMGEALAAADLVIVTEIYPAREQPIPGVSGSQVADAAERAGAATVFESDRPAVGRRVLGLIRPGDVVLTLGAGDITRVGPELVQWLRAA